MDLTFGSQDLLDSLSAGSRQSSRSGGGRAPVSNDAASVGGASAMSMSTAGGNNPVEEAYRNLGQRLSLRASGGLGQQRQQQQQQQSTLSHQVQLQEQILLQQQLHARGGGQHHQQQQQQQRYQQEEPRVSSSDHSSCFQPYNRRLQQQHVNNRMNLGGTSGLAASLQQHPAPSAQGGPTPKVAKLGSFDGNRHDHHHGYDGYNLASSSSGGGSNLRAAMSQQYVKKITVHAKETYTKWRRAQKQPGYHQRPAADPKKHSSTTLSTSASTAGTNQQEYAASGGNGGDDDAYQKLTEEQLKQHQQQLNGGTSSLSKSLQHGDANNTNNDKGLLSSVLEANSESTFESESVHSLPTITSHPATMKNNNSASGGGGGGYHQYPPPSGGSPVLPTANAAAAQYNTPRGSCLTQPGEPTSNEGLDNVEGNLIMFENDVILVPPADNNSNASKPKSRRGMEFHVQSLLGQGTFAQVFCCWESSSKQHVALKVIKNKPAFTKQAAVEIEVFQALAKKTVSASSDGSGNNNESEDPTEGSTATGGYIPTSPHMVRLLSSFMYQSHLCLVFECLGLNLYEVLKRRQFRGLPLTMVRTLMKQAMEGVKDLAGKTIVHCDLKPENILLVSDEVEKKVVGAGTTSSRSAGQPPAAKDSGDGSSVATADKSTRTTTSTGSTSAEQSIKLIDFGSACFEGHSAHTYIQSRFYRSPEVLMGLPYDSAIDMWSIGCVAAELYLGLPILPGVHEHDQCGRIIEMIGEIPDWMLEQGHKASKYFVKYVPRHSNPRLDGTKESPDKPGLPQWRLKSQDEYVKSLSQSEIRKKGGLEKLQKQPTNRYFKRTKLADIIMLHGQNLVGEEKELLGMFVHFLYGVLDPDPWKRWTAYQASQHPFLAGSAGQLKRKTPETKFDLKEENQANKNFDVYWTPPWDPGICRRKLLNVQKMREKQNAQRRGYPQNRSHGLESDDVSMKSAGRGQPMMVADSPSVGQMSIDSRNSPPSQLASKLASYVRQQQRLSEGLGAASMPKQHLMAISSSLSDLGPPSGLGAALAMEDPNSINRQLLQSAKQAPQTGIMGPQSFNSVAFETHRNPNDVDLGVALQRPGNVPGMGGDATVVSQKSINSQSNSHHQLLQQQQQSQYGRMPPASVQQQSLDNRGIRKYPPSSQASSSVNSLPNAAGFSNNHLPAGMAMKGGVSYQQYANNSFDSGNQSYSTNSVRGDDRSDFGQSLEYQQQLLLQEQQKQLAALHRQQQEQLQALQQQQRLAFQQQQQQQYMGQYGTTGGGYYYVNAADGTPMLMPSGGGQQPQQQQLGSSVELGMSYDSRGSSGGYMLPPQQLQHQQLRNPSFDDDGSSQNSRSVNQRIPRQTQQGRRNSNDYRGGPGMSM